MISHLHYIHTSPPDLLVKYFRKKGYPDAGKCLITDLFDIKAAGEIEIELTRDTPRLAIAAEGLSVVAAIAQTIRTGIRCQAVRLAWLWGAGVVTKDQILLADFSRKCSDRVALAITRKAYLERGHTEEEVQGFIDDMWHPFHDEDTVNESFVRTRLHTTWQDLAIQSKDYPDEAALRTEPMFALFFDMGFKVENYEPEASAKMRSLVSEIRSVGLSYTDLEKSKAYLREIPGESWQAHAGRIDQFFKNAPPSLREDVQAFMELIPVSHGQVLKYAADNVRSTVQVGLLAAQKINGFPSGYFFLMGPARVEMDVMGIALLADREENRKWLPPKSAARIKQHVDRLHQLLDEAPGLDQAATLDDAQIEALRTEMLSGVLRFEDMKQPVQARFKAGYEAGLRLIWKSYLERPTEDCETYFVNLVLHMPFRDEGDADRCLWLSGLAVDPAFQSWRPGSDSTRHLLGASMIALDRYCALVPEDVAAARRAAWWESLGAVATEWKASGRI